MKSIKNFSAINRTFSIIVEAEALSAIKHIVSIAPEEAQWFHTVEPIHDPSNPNKIQLLLSNKLYIPKQNTSVAQVDSTSSMMIEFYNELKKEYSDQDVVNQKLSSMTCWCHSHHNMAPSPSGQDNNQFNSFVKSSLDQGMNTWQIMLIFNKKDEFYSRVRDPLTGVVYEGVPIVQVNSFDFSYIDKAAKEKFIKPKMQWGALGKNNLTRAKQHSLFTNQFTSNTQTVITNSYNVATVEDIISEAYFWVDEKLHSTTTACMKDPYVNEALECLNFYLSFKEYVYLAYIISRNISSLTKLYKDQDVNAQKQTSIDDLVKEYLTTTKDTINVFSDSILNALELAKQTTKRNFNKKIKQFEKEYVYA